MNWHGRLCASPRTEICDGCFSVRCAGQFCEIGNRSFKPFVKLHTRFPAQALLCEFDIRAPSLRVVHGQSLMDQPRSRTCQLDDLLGQLKDSELFWVAKIYRTGEIVRIVHQSDQAVYQIVNIAETPGLFAVTERVIKTLKYEWLRCVPLIKGFDHVARLCTQFECWYNVWRPHMALDGLRPDDLYYGHKLDKPKRNAKTVPGNIERHIFRDTRLTAYRLKTAA